MNIEETQEYKTDYKRAIWTGSAVAAARQAAIILITAWLMVPVHAVLNRMADGAWHVDWGFRFFFGALVSVLWFVGSFFWIAIAAFRDKSTD